jgi:N-acyl-D-amino-acid deacylase
MRPKNLLVALTLLLSACGADYDVIIRGGSIYDGTGKPPVVTDLAIDGDTIAEIGDLTGRSGRIEVDAGDMAVAPGFINMLSWATESLLVDGRGMSDILQGVTLEVMGEGNSMGPLSAEMRDEMLSQQGDLKFQIPWTTLGEYLEHLERRGVSPNVASFLGAATPRRYVIGHEDRPPTPVELEQMLELVREAMEEGAMGVASALIYAPGFYADTDELIELAGVAAEYGGLYISHLRSEGDAFLEAFDEFLTITRSARIRSEIYHLKAAGQSNWSKLDQIIERVEAARADGMEITADMYTYTAGATGLDAAMPPWVQEDGLEAWIERLSDPAIRRQVAEEMRTGSTEWENLYAAAGSAENLLLVGFKNDDLKPLTGKTLAEVAGMRGKSPEEAAMDLVVEDGSRVGTVYFLMSEENVKRQIALPWVSFCSDAGAPASEGAFLKSNPHPRAYGNFARLLGKYVREERVIPLEEAIRKITSLPAQNLQLKSRGALQEGYFADVVVFDPSSIIDHATFAEPHQYATGMRHVFVNGVQVVKDGQHTGATPGRFIRGPGWTGK